VRSVALVLVVSLVLSMPLHAPAQPQASAEPATRELFGVDLGPGLDPAGIARSGSRWVRVIADWSLLEPVRGTYAWADLDAAVGRATAAELRVVAVVVNTPKWAALTPEAPETVWRHQPPRDLAVWQAFIEAAASRYRGRVAAWQVEPVLDFAVFRGTALDYLAMLHAARASARRGDPQAGIVAASPPGLDLAYIKAMFMRAADDFDALMLSPRGRAPEGVLEALATMRARIPTDARREIWLADADGGGAPSGPADAGVGGHMVRLAAVDVAAGIAREFWSGRQLSPQWAPVRETVIRMLTGKRFVGWLPRGPGIYAFIFTDGRERVGVVWSTAGPQTIPLPAEGALNVIMPTGAVSQPVSRDGTPAVVADSEPVFVQGLAPSVLAEAAQAAGQGAFRIPRDPAHDFSKADSASVTLGAANTERGLYNMRFRTLPAGAVASITVDGMDAVRTDQAKDAVYIYLDVDHSFVYFVDGREDLLITVEVRRARAAQQVGFNLLYDSMSGYRFTPWQWVEPGSGWVTYTIRLTDASFSSAWGWDFAINGAGNKREDLVVRSVVVRKAPPGRP
jgi:hypothetical protein